MTSMRLFNTELDRKAGMLLPISSLPSGQGIGCFDEHARRFIDVLKEARLAYWQLCPLGPTGYGDSPYQCFSAFAGNPYFIDLGEFLQTGLLTEEEVMPLRGLPENAVDYGHLYQHFWGILRIAHRRFSETGDKAFENFQKVEKKWLLPYATYRALKGHFEEKCWIEWPQEFRSFQKASASSLCRELKEDIDFHQFTQFFFFKQWKALKAYAKEQGIAIIGDIPIFAGLDSADVWTHSELFQIKKDLPTHVAGVPPDYFSPEGQLWGNPLFNWKALENSHFDWWIERIEHNFRMFDVVRLDHFRGFYDYWKVPYGAPNAIKGEWEKGPGLAFFQAIHNKIPSARLIAEDLGYLSKEVVELRKAVGLPGMAILQFAFGGDSENIYLPHNLDPHTVIYSGSHDNDTSIGWYAGSNESTRDHLRRYLRINGSEVAWDLIRSAYASVANWCIFPMQDFLSLPSWARINTPGKAQGNWAWRMTPHDLDLFRYKNTEYLQMLADLYGRR